MRPLCLLSQVGTQAELNKPNKDPHSVLTSPSRLVKACSVPVLKTA